MKEPAREKTTNQVRAIHAEARKHGLDHDTLHDLIESVTKRTRSIAALTHKEALAVIRQLKGKGFVPLRTLQYRRQQAGVQQLVQPTQLTLIAELASQRGWSAEALQSFCQRQCKRTRPRTTTDANKVIEALKAMNQRDKLWPA